MGTIFRQCCKKSICSIYQFFVSRGFFGWSLGHKTLENRGLYQEYRAFFNCPHKVRIPECTDAQPTIDVHSAKFPDNPARSGFEGIKVM